MAQAYRNATITAVSNSTTQREFIMRRARDLELHNVQVLTADMVDFQVGRGGAVGGRGRRRGRRGGGWRGGGREGREGEGREGGRARGSRLAGWYAGTW
jgi:hypothetical protein